MFLIDRWVLRIRFEEKLVGYREVLIALFLFG